MHQAALHVVEQITAFCLDAARSDTVIGWTRLKQRGVGSGGTDSGHPPIAHVLRRCSHIVDNGGQAFGQQLCVRARLVGDL
jgi:hypothetical protein